MQYSIVLQRIKMTNSLYYWGSKGSQTLTKTGPAYSTKREIKDWMPPDNNEAAVEEAVRFRQRWQTVYRRVRQQPR